MANQFSVQPANFGQGLQGIMGGIQQYQGRQAVAQEEQNQANLMSEAQRLLESGTAQEVSSFVLANPEIGEKIRGEQKYANEATEAARKRGMMDIIAGNNPRKAVQDTADKVRKAGGDPSDILKLLELPDEQIKADTLKYMPFLFPEVDLSGVEVSAKEEAETAKLGAETKLLEQEFKALGDPSTPTEDTIKIEKNLRQEVFNRSKDFEKVDDAWRRVEVSAKEPSAAGDMAMIFNYMKMLDPGSTVREGEFATAQKAGGVDDRVRSTYNQILEGTRLSPKQRADFTKRAKSLYAVAKKKQDRTSKKYKGLAKRYGVDYENVILGVDKPELSDEDLLNKYGG